MEVDDDHCVELKNKKKTEQLKRRNNESAGFIA